MLRRRHRAERGQALLMALAMIAFFGLVTTSMLRFTGTVELEQSNASNIAEGNAASEGGALFAAADALGGGSGSPYSQGSCVAGSRTIMVIPTDGRSAPSRQTVQYTTESCNPGATANLLAQQCAVCVLGTRQASSIAGSLAAQGPVAFNAVPQVTGSVTSLIPLQSGATNPGFIGCIPAGPGCTGAGYSPSADALTVPIADPLSQVQLPSVPPPSPDGPGAGPCLNVDSTWEPSTPIPPGVYCSITLRGDATYTLQGGVYTVLNILQVSDRANLQSAPGGPGALLYFTCHDDGSSGGSIGYVGACQGGDADGGVFDFSSSGKVSLAPFAASGGNPEGVVMYFDRLEDAPAYYAPFTSCHGGALLCVNGTGEVDLGGTVYTASGQVDVLDGQLNIAAAGSPSPTGDLVAATLTVASGASADVDGLVPASGYCWVYDDVATVTQDSTTVGRAHVVVQVNCPNGEGGTASGIVDVNYGS